MQSPAWLSPAGLLPVSALCPFFGPFGNTTAREAGDLDRSSQTGSLDQGAAIRPGVIAVENSLSRSSNKSVMGLVASGVSGLKIESWPNMVRATHLRSAGFEDTVQVTTGSD